jgi:hypothetical protein
MQHNTEIKKGRGSLETYTYVRMILKWSLQKQGVRGQTALK